MLYLSMRKSLFPVILSMVLLAACGGGIPYIVYVLNKEYIQNETIAENRIYISDNTFIGRNVTSSVDNGPVSVEDGKIIIYNQHGATIKNSFEVKKGATFEIK